MKSYQLEYGLSEQPLEKVSGDISFYKQSENTAFIAVIDVAGHGEHAHELAMKAQLFIAKHFTLPLTELISDLHHYIHGSRGLVIMLAQIDLASLLLTYSGMGNVELRSFSEKKISKQSASKKTTSQQSLSQQSLGQQSSRGLSRDGVVGYMISSPQERQLQLQANDVILLYSDGIKAHFELSDYPEILSDSAALISKNVLQRFGKTHDDQCCVAIKVLEVPND